MLSHDCEIDKPNCKVLLVVRIRESGIYQADVWELAKQDRLVNGMYLPENDGEPDGFVDFRHIHRVRKDAILSCKKVASLSDEARIELTEHLNRFVSEPARSRFRDSTL